jgi:uroporphyrinogen-III synthase
MCLSPAISMTLPQAWQARALAADHPDEDSLLASLARLG